MAGNFNQWPIDSALVEFLDLKEVHVGPTRAGRSIDRVFCNVARRVSEAGTVPPLEAENSTSDHGVAYVRAAVPRVESFEWVSYSYRHFTEEAQEAFNGWIVLQDWSPVYAAGGSNKKARAYQNIINEGLDKFFPIRSTRRKSTDLPWINKAIRKKIRRRKLIYLKEGRSELWKWLKGITDDTIKKRKKGYMDNKKQQASQSFFRLVKCFNAVEKQQNFDVRSLRPDNFDAETAEELADF